MHVRKATEGGMPEDPRLRTEIFDEAAVRLSAMLGTRETSTSSRPSVDP